MRNGVSAKRGIAACGLMCGLLGVACSAEEPSSVEAKPSVPPAAGAARAGAPVQAEPVPRERNEPFALRDHGKPLKRMLRTPQLQKFLSLWGANSEGLFRNQFLGIDTIQNPFDVWVTQEILYEVKPDFVVETGTFRGGSAALWATLLAQINPDARVLTVDIEDSSAEAKELPIVREKVDFWVGSSTDPEIVREISERVRGGRVLVILDSLHTREHVFEELKLYSPLVSVGSYVIVQDTGMAVPSPAEMGWANQGVEDFLKIDDDFQVDRRRERLIITNNPGGFLKRIR